MKLPNGDKAIIDLEKLTEYALNPEHPTGRHKAYVFKSALGIEREDAAVLLDFLMQVAISDEIVDSSRTPYGTRYVLDSPLATDHGEAIVRSAWIIRNDEDFPRLTSCYVR
ncbi:MAG: hypothetical protein SF123_11250 [Chloroflexota bacterium]|nr:hypothetical protein [Chloroflexota bacterium]